MKLTIVYDNEVFKRGIGLRSDWGFSCLIQNNEDFILFDSGAKGDILINNMRKLKLDPRNINKIVISHEHWDHNGGLDSLNTFINNVELYRFNKKKASEKMNLLIVENSALISNGIYTTGRLSGKPVDEQSLVLKGKKGLYVLVGCSHPSVEKILRSAKQFNGIVGIIGGMHDFDMFSILDDLNTICPCHCTKYKNKIKEIFPDKYIAGGVGRVIEI
jgi:7,8-dihydropterin-6-yl-methyl-4-(beta-D-ribofuranosyl)aminobenzene 5'-phosphate synthase